MSEPDQPAAPDPDQEDGEFSPTLPYERPDEAELGGLDPRELIEAGLHSRTSPLRWEPPSPEALSRLLPQYEIDALLGRGGMGAVYRGRQAALDRPVAIKLLPAEMATDPEFVARFQREARTLAKLHHPGIVLVHDFGQTAEGHLYFVMEFVDGTDLHRIIHGPGLECAQVLEIIGQICDALQYAHGQGVVHRDIKPANVILTQDGRTKLADFGLARPLEDGSGTFTRSNVVMGTPDYMAPEALAGEADHRADLYSLGVMLYEMLTGKPPRGAWAPPSQRVQVDVRLDQVVLRALQEDPELRYQQASEIKTDVDGIRSTPVGKAARGKGKAKPKPVSATASKSADVRKRRSLVVIAAVGVAVAVALGFFQQWALKDRESTPGEPGAAPESPGAEVTEIQLEPQVIAARERGGRLKVFGNGPTGTFDLGEAAQFDDFNQIVVSEFGWVARRNNGDTWCGLWGQGDQALSRFDHFETRFLSRAAHPSMLLKEPGIARIVVARNLLGRNAENGEGPPPFTDSVIAVTDHCFALDARGQQTRIFGEGIDDIQDFFRNSSRITGTDRHFICGRPGELLRSWAPADGFSGIFPEETRMVVEVDGGHEFVILRYADGRVELRTPEGKQLPTSFSSKVDNTPTENGQFVAVRAGRGMAATQNPDGSWVAWGESEKLPLEVAKLGHVVDLDFDYDGKQSEFLMWIEPVTDEAPTPEAQPTSPLLTATKDAPFVNSLGMKFVPVPGTDILMCIHETRRKDYAVFAAEVPGVDETWKNPERNGKPLVQNGEHPVISVSWKDASAFCSWLSRKEVRNYRVPTESEWNRAVVFDLDDPIHTSDGDIAKKLQEQFPWGTANEADAPRYGNYNGIVDGYDGTAGVMSFLPNHLGIFDLGGNAWELCGTKESGISLRGCNYHNFGRFRLSRTRSTIDADFRIPPPGDNTRGAPGFRCVVELEKAEAAPSIPWTRVERTAEEWAKTGQALQEDGWISSPAENTKGAKVGLSAEPMTDFVIRLHYRWNIDSSHLHLTAREFASKTAAAQVWREFVVLSSCDVDQASLSQVNSRKSWESKLQPGHEGLLEMAVIGNRVTARFDEEFVLTGEVPDLKSQGDAVIRSAGVSIRDIEIASLEGIPDPLKALGWEVESASYAIPWTRIERTAEEWAKTGQILHADGWVLSDNKEFVVFDRSHVAGASATSQFAVRARVKFHEPESVLNFMNRNDGGSAQRGVQIWPNKLSFRNEAREPSQMCPHAEKVAVDEEAYVEILYSGDKAYTRFNGQPVETGDVSPAIPWQKCRLNSGLSYSLRDLEYAILDGIDDPLAALGWEIPTGEPIAPIHWAPADFSDGRAAQYHSESPDGWATGTPDNPGGRDVFLSNGSLGNFAVRLRYRWNQGSRQLQVRVREPGLVTAQAVLFGNHWSISEYDPRRPSETRTVKLASITNPKNKEAGSEGVIEVAVIGDQVFARFDGKQLVKAQVKGMAAQGFAKIMSAGLSFRDVEMASLDGIPDPLKALGWEMPLD